MNDKLKIYYINLNRSQDRNLFMLNQFKLLGWEVIRVEAIDGNELPQFDIDKIINKLKASNEHYTLPNVGEIGVYMSHKKVWQLISQQKEDFALVLEDDALIDKKFINDIDTLLSMISKNEILDISGIKGFYKKESQVKNNVEIINYLTPSLMVISSIIGKDSAKRLLETFNEYTIPVDNMIQQVYKHKIKVWITKDKYVRTNYKNLGGSTIQKTKKTSITEKIKKEILRPIYRLKTHIKNKIGYRK